MGVRRISPNTLHGPLRLNVTVTLTLLAIIGVESIGACQEGSLAVEGLLARSEAISSLDLEYRLTTGFHKTPVPGSTESVVQDGSFRLTLQNGDWSVKGLDNLSGARINKGGKFLVYKKAKQKNDTIRHSVNIYASEAIGLESPMPPFFAGSIWYRCTLDYIRKNAKLCKQLGEASCDGHRVEILEWEVSRNDRGAFHAVTPEVAKGGTLRVYVSPELGYAVCRIEYVAVDQSIPLVFESSQFEEQAPGVFIPRHMKFQSKPGYFMQYEITKVLLVNKSVPDDHFTISIPIGTNVADHRFGKVVTFKVGDATSLDRAIPDLGDVIHYPQPHAFWWLTTILAGGACGVFMFAAWILYRRWEGGLGR